MSTGKQSILFAVVSLVVVAIVAIGMWDWCSYGGRAARWASSEDPAVRMQAVRHFTKRSSTLAVNTLRRLADDADVAVVVQAVAALGDCRTESARLALLEVLDSDAPPIVRGEAAATAGMYAATDVERLGAALAADNPVELRIGATKGIARLRDRKGLAHLMKALKQDPDPHVRTMTVVAMQKILVAGFLYDAKASAATQRTQIEYIEKALSSRGLI